MFFTTLRYRKNIRILCGNFWLMEWPKVDGIFVFLLEKYMPKLDAKIAQRYSRVKLASFAFKVPGKEIKATKSGVFLYNYNKSKN